MPALFRPLLVLVLVLLMGCLQPARAGSLTCKGSLSEILYTTTSELRVRPSWRSNWITLCNTSVAWKGVPPEVCQLWQAQVLIAQITQGGTTLQYDSTAATGCATMGTNSNADGASFLANY